jgi:hypothetical protein
MSPQAILHVQGISFDAAKIAQDSISNGFQLSTHPYETRVAGWYAGNVTWYGDLSVSTNESHFFGNYSFTESYSDENFYGAVYLLPVWAAGNQRLLGPSTQPVSHIVMPAGVPSTLIHATNGAPLGFDTISGVPLAKNVLTVGAVGDISGGYSGPSSVSLWPSSGCGPTDDGRIKPDIVGNGVLLLTTGSTSDTHYVTASGTSLSTPNVAGSLNLLAEVHQLYHGTNYPLWASTMKALAIHTADEAGAADGPDFMYGWGLLNTRKAAELMRANATNAGLPHIKEVVLLNDDCIEFAVTNAGGGANPLRVTIAWTDPPGPLQPNVLDPTNLVLVNDLDARVIGPGASGPTNFPWVLNPNNPTSPATRADNFRDNVEQVHIASPTAGVYTVRVVHKGALTNGYQNVSIIISGNKPTPPPDLRISDFRVWPIEYRYIEWPSIVGGLYRIETTQELVGGVWTGHVADISATKTNMILGTLPTPAETFRSYRLKRLK